MLILSSTRRQFRICDVLVDNSGASVFNVNVNVNVVIVAAMTLFNVDVVNS
jgi:hypothetical protein